MEQVVIFTALSTKEKISGTIFEIISGIRLILTFGTDNLDEIDAKYFKTDNQYA
jgi:hypothetical protein